MKGQAELGVQRQSCPAEEPIDTRKKLPERTGKGAEIRLNFSPFRKN
jgi:hypothetical protein